jgi:hypothetical protein
MADDNDIKDKTRRKLNEINPLSSTVNSRIRNIYQSTAEDTKKILDLRSRVEKLNRGIYKLNTKINQKIEQSKYRGGFTLDEESEFEKLKDYQNRAINSRFNAQQELEEEQRNRLQNASRVASKYVSSRLTPEKLRSGTSVLSSSSEAMFLARDYARSMTQSQLESLYRGNIGHQQRTVGKIEDVIARLAVDESGEFNPAVYAQIARHTSSLTRQQGFGSVANAAISLQRELGIDEKSIQRRSRSISSVIDKEERQENAILRVQSGQTRNLQEELNIYRNLREELKKTTKEIESLGDTSVDLRNKQEDQIKAVEDQKELIRQMQKQGAGGGGGGFVGRLEAFGRGASVASGLASYALVESEIEQTRVRAGLAAVMNQRFFDQKEALSGNMTSLLMSSSGINDIILKRGEYLGSVKTGTAAVDTGGRIATTAASIASGKFADGINEMSSAAKGAIDLGKGISTGEVRIAGVAAARQLNQEQIRIRAESLQEFYNDRMAAYQASVGAGSLSSTLMSEMTNPEMASRIGFIDLNRQKRLFSTGVSQVGRAFTQDPNQRASIIESAAAAERTGMMRAEQYMSNLGQITAAGGSKKDLEDIMANAVARGVSDAASIEKMVDSITNLSESINQGRGVGGAGAAARALQFGLDTYKGTNIDERQRIQGAMYGAQALQAMTSGADMDLGSLSQIGFLSKELPGLSGMPLQNVIKLGVGGASNVLQMMKDPNVASNKDTRRKIQDLGLTSVFYDNNGKLTKDSLKKAEAIMQSELLSTGAGVGVSATAEQYEEYMEYLKNPSKKRFESLSGGLRDVLAGRGITQAGVESFTNELAGKSPSASGVNQPFGDFKEAQDSLKMQTEASAKYMNSFGNNLKEVTDRMKSVLKDFDPEKSFSQTQQTVEKMNLDTKGFSDAVIRFKDAVEIFAQTQGRTTKIPKTSPPPQTKPAKGSTASMFFGDEEN